MGKLTKYVLILTGSLIVGGCGLVVAGLLLDHTLPYRLTPEPVAAPAPITRHPESTSPPQGVPGESQAGDNEEDDVLDETEAVYTEAKQELRTALDERKESLPGEIVDPLEQDLGIIENAVADLLTALASDPDDESLKRMLIATYRNELRLLKKALHLTPGEPDEGEEGAE